MIIEDFYLAYNEGFGSWLTKKWITKAQTYFFEGYNLVKDYFSSLLNFLHFHYLYSTRGLWLVSVLEALSRTPHSYELTSRRGSLLGIAWHAGLLLDPRKKNKRAGPEITVLIFKKCIDG